MYNLNFLNAISPLDGRYGSKLTVLREIFSEYSLLKFRIEIEIRWLKMLANHEMIKEVPKFTNNANDYLNSIITNFNVKEAQKIKKIEQKINHDVKAIEYFLKKKFIFIPELHAISEFIHFGCTSDDINNLSYALMLKKAKKDLFFFYWNILINSIKHLSIKYRKQPMMCRTHGQPATSSTVGKEMANVVYRLQRQFSQLKKIKILGKINGSVGNYNAQTIAYPNVNWHHVSQNFVSSLGITWNPYTTQIEPHDYIAEFFHCISRYNTIMIDFNRDIWGYISLNYFKQKNVLHHIGSSIMPHKINPINFENSEGNLGLANAIMQHLCNTLPISRWQRDLKDSTLLRNLGMAIGYSIIGYQSVIKGIQTLEINNQNILYDLKNNWQILSEPIQTVMRKYGVKNSYEKLKVMTRGKKISEKDLQIFIKKQNKIPKKEKNILKKITPCNYLGYAIQLVDALKKSK